MGRVRVAPVVLALLIPPSAVFAQDAGAAPLQRTLRTAGGAVQEPEGSAPGTENPWAGRPVCASMFLKSDWKLTGRQRSCDWLQNRLLSNGALFGAAGSAVVSRIRNPDSEQGDPFAVRFGRRYAQSAFKSTGAYLGGLIAREDPRLVPPYLVMRSQARPRGLWRRTRHALATNVMSYDCVGDCKSESDIRRRFALSRVLGAVASGYGSEVWTWDRANSHSRAWRGAGSAYGSSFADALYTEFKPEVTAAAGKVFGGLFGFK